MARETYNRVNLEAVDFIPLIGLFTGGERNGMDFNPDLGGYIQSLAFSIYHVASTAAVILVAGKGIESLL